MWGVWRTRGGRHARRRMLSWTRYIDRCDALAADQDLTYQILAPIRTTPGYFRAEGWETGPRSVFRHGV